MPILSTRKLLRISEWIDRINGQIGRAAAFAVLAMVAIQLLVIIARALGFGLLWLRESLVYCHAALALFAAAWTLRHDGHVRVDIVYADARPRTQALIDLIGAVALLAPFMIAILWLSAPYVWRSWAIMEGSHEAEGLPLVFLLKTTMLVFAVQMLLQGLSQGIRAALALSRRERPKVAARS